MQIAHEFFVRRWILKWLFINDGKQFLRLAFQSACREFLCVFLCVFGVNNFPTLSRQAGIQSLKASTFQVTWSPDASGWNRMASMRSGRL